MKNLPKPLKITLTAFGFLVILIIILAIINQVSRSGKIAVLVKYAPFSAEINLNGKTINNNTTNYLAPGDYELTATLEHFNTFTETITITEDTKYLLGKLVASDETGENIMSERQFEFQAVEGIYGQISAEAGQKIKEQYSILQQLPINNDFYSISFSYLADGSPKIILDAPAKYLDLAVQKTLLLNDKIINYEISFSTASPFMSTASAAATDPTTLIQSRLQNLSYQINPGKTIDNYYITSVYLYNQNLNEKYAHFKIILQNTNETWQFAATPQPIFTTKNTSNIPENILNQANKF